MANYIRFFDQIGRDDVSLVGGKGANLGEMSQAGFPVPPGFCVTAQAYFDFCRQNHLDKVIKSQLTDLDVNNAEQLERVAQKIRLAILHAPMPSKIKQEVREAYTSLSGSGKRDIPVAVRSSATAEDLPEASFAGQQESFMNMRGEKEVLEAIQHCWGSLFTARSIFYRQQQGFDHLKVGLAVPVQKMVLSEVSGVMFTLDPLTNDVSKLTIEAVFGLGDAVVSGSITPDQYQVDKKTLQILDTKVVKQTKMMASVSKTGHFGKSKALAEKFIFTPVAKTWQERKKLSDEEIIKLAELGKKVEEHYGYPQDIEWAKAGNKLYLTQTRPVTTIKVSDESAAPDRQRSQDAATSDLSARIEIKPRLPEPILTGTPASPGVAAGPVAIIHSSKEIGKVKKGEILVTEMTTPDFVPAMRRAVAIVTNEGGKTSHAAIVSRELGVPCVVGTQTATRQLKNKQLITVDGMGGMIYEGDLCEAVSAVQKSEIDRPSVASMKQATATKIYVNLGELERAAEVAQMPVDGVGLLRAEFMILSIGYHPRYLLEHKRRHEFVDKLYDGLLTFAREFDPRPVIYRTTDFRTNEFRNLKGGAKYEQEEENPMLGFRGIMRYIADAEVFKMELEAVKRVRRYHKNLWVMLPFVRTPQELIEGKKIMASMDLNRGGSFKLLIMVEVPSSVILLEEMIGAGIDGVSIGSNDLTQLILGLDRDNSRVSYLFDERNPAVLWALEKTITTCKKHGILSSICGQAPSIYPDLTRQLVKWGISSVSVSPDAVELTRQTVAQAEYDLVRQGA